MHDAILQCDLVIAIFASFGIRVLRFGGVCSLWRDCARVAAERCEVLRLELSTGRYWEADDEENSSEGEDDEVEENSSEGEGGEAVAGGLRVNASCTSIVATPEGLLLNDTNNQRLLFVSCSGEPVRVYDVGQHCDTLAYAGGSIYTTICAGAYSDGEQIPVIRRLSLATSELCAGSDETAGLRVFSDLVVADGSLLVAERIRGGQSPLAFSGHGVVLEYDAVELTFTSEFCKEGAMSLVVHSESLLLLAPSPPFATATNRWWESYFPRNVHVSTYCLSTRRLQRRIRVPDFACSIEAHEDRLFVATTRQPHTPGELYVLLLDGTLLQTVTVHATGGPADLCIAHDRLFCLCAVEPTEEFLFEPEEVEGGGFDALGQEQMHALCSFRLVGPATHF